MCTSRGSFRRSRRPWTRRHERADLSASAPQTLETLDEHPTLLAGRIPIRQQLPATAYESIVEAAIGPRVRAG